MKDYYVQHESIIIFPISSHN